MFILLPVEIISGKYRNAIDIFRVFRKQAYLRSPAHADPAQSVPLHRTDIRSAVDPVPGICSRHFPSALPGGTGFCVIFTALSVI